MHVSRVPMCIRTDAPERMHRYQSCRQEGAVWWRRSIGPYRAASPLRVEVESMEQLELT